MADSRHTEIAFSVHPLPEDTFHVLRMTGEEGLSSLFEFHVDLQSTLPGIDIARLVGRPAMLTLAAPTGADGQTHERRIGGIVTRLEVAGALPDETYHYRARMVPRLWRLSLGCETRMHGALAPVTVADVLAAELTGEGINTRFLKDAAARLLEGDVSFRLTRDYPHRDQIMQYRETDLDFCRRLMEREGIFFFFDMAEDEDIEMVRDVLVVADDHVGLPSLGAGSELSYAPEMHSDDMQAIVGFNGRVDAVPRRVLLKDYNERLPHVPLTAEAEVDPNGEGVVFLEDEHFLTPEEGAVLARIRAEELRCNKELFFGTGSAVELSPGHKFRLEQHFRAAYNAVYLVTRLRHAGWQPPLEDVEPIPGLGPPPGTNMEFRYRNWFEALPGDAPYRPPRTTPKPMMHGVTTAHVEGAGDGRRSDIDEEGRYRVRTPQDLTDRPAGKASAPLRLMQPYGGLRHGQHFPLTPETEVMLAAVGGDPDRPLILGAVPNARTRSVVERKSRSANRIVTASGILVEFEDGLDGRGEDGRGDDGSGEAEAMAAEQRQMAVAEAVAEMAPPADATSPAQANGSFARFSVPGRSYLRLGAPPASGEPAAGEPASGEAASGWHDHTGADRSSHTAGARRQSVGGDDRLAVGGDRHERVEGALHRALMGGEMVERQGESRRTLRGATTTLRLGDDLLIGQGSAMTLESGHYFLAVLGVGFTHMRLRVDRQWIRDEQGALSLECHQVKAALGDGVEIRRLKASVESSQIKLFT